MDTEFLVQMRQSDKCGSVRNDDIFNLHLGSGAGPWVSIPCLWIDIILLVVTESRWIGGLIWHNFLLLIWTSPKFSIFYVQQKKKYFLILHSFSVIILYVFACLETYFYNSFLHILFLLSLLLQISLWLVSRSLLLSFLI